MIKHQSLLTKIGSIIDKHNQLLDNIGGRFNVFKTVGLTTEETRLHSSFLAELLDPHGSHGLKGKPLKAFLRYCLKDNFDFDVEHARCVKEYYIGPKTETTGGQIDIVVKDNRNRAIIIENKINAGDQENQMLRYYNHSNIYTDSILIYLSLDGKNATEYSTGQKEFDYTSISYKYDMIDWLEECRRIAVDFPLVREGIAHYINLIKQLTNTSTMDEMKDEIVSLVMQSSDNMKNAFELEKSLIDVKIKLQWEFWKQLDKSLQNVGVKLKDGDYSQTVKHWKVKGYYEKQRNKEMHYGLWSEIYNQGGITFHWGCEVESNIYWGFTIEKDGRGGISNDKEYEAYRAIIKECDEKYKIDSPYWLGWQYPDPQLNFREFNSDSIFALTDKDTMERVTNEIANKVKIDIDFVLSKVRLLNNL